MQAPAAHQRFVTCTTTMKAKLEWTIPFSEVEEKNLGDYFQSPNFYASGEESRQWLVKLYPNRSKFKDHFTFLVHPASPLESECEATITAQLLNQNRDSYLFYETKDVTFPARSTGGQGFTLVDPNMLLLGGSDLVVRCKLEYQAVKLLPSSGKHSDLAADISRSFSNPITDGDVTFVIGEK